MMSILRRGSGSASPRTLALLGSLCLFLSAIEYIIPKPFPFMRIGLANLPLLLALDIFSPIDFFLLALLKVVGQGIISGSLFSYVFLFSLAGTFSSAIAMYLLRRLFGRKLISFAAVGCAGALISNSVQLVLAQYLVFGTALRYLIPPFLASGFVTGIALGVFCEIFCRRSKWYAGLVSAVEAGLEATSGAGIKRGTFAANAARLRLIAGLEATTVAASKAEKSRLRRRQRWNELFNSGFLFIAGLIIAVGFTFNPSILICVILFAVFCVLAWIAGVKINPLVMAVIIAGIVFVNLLAPYGKVLFELGPLQITQGSLLVGVKKALVLEGLILLSGVCIKSDLRLPGKFGALLAESFRLLELMRERKGLIRRGRFIEGVDSLLLELEK